MSATRKEHIPNWKEHISLKEAWAILKEEFTNCTPPSEEVPVQEAHGRVLARDVTARLNIPHFNASAMDGYALRAADTANASPARPAVLPEGRFVWLNTGAPLPPAYDAVLMVEDSSLSVGGGLTVPKSLTPGENVRAIGEDIAYDQLAAREGDTVTPALAALLLALGQERVSVLARPRVLFIPTGDEIVPANDWLKTGVQENRIPGHKVPESNSTMLAGYFRRWDVPFECAPLIGDDPELLDRTIEAAAERFSLILIGAGSAKGEKDFSAAVLKRHRILFHWLLMKPGRPVLAARHPKAWIVVLPGFPMSALAALWSVAYPLLRLMQTGTFDEERLLPEALGALESAEARLLLSHSSPPGRLEWMRVKAVELDGALRAFPLGAGASAMSAMAEADGFAVLPETRVECEKGSPVTVWLTRSVDWKRRILFQGSNDPAFELLATPARRRGGELILRSVGSLGGLAALSRGEAHVASCHLLDAATGRYNDSFIESMREKAEIKERWRRYPLFWREQGIVVARGNPRNIREIRDLARGDVSIVNRQPGAGTRVLLDYLLERDALSPKDIRGYERQLVTHFDAANRVAAGLADAALAIRVAAKALGLDFVFLALEPYELVIPERHAEHPGVLALLAATRDEEWRARVEDMGGYRWTAE